MTKHQINMKRSSFQKCQVTWSVKFGRVCREIYHGAFCVLAYLGSTFSSGRRRWREPT